MDASSSHFCLQSLLYSFACTSWTFSFTHSQGFLQLCLNASISSSTNKYPCISAQHKPRTNLSPSNISKKGSHICIIQQAFAILLHSSGWCLNDSPSWLSLWNLAHLPTTYTLGIRWLQRSFANSSCIFSDGLDGATNTYELYNFEQMMRNVICFFTYACQCAMYCVALEANHNREPKRKWCYLHMSTLLNCATGMATRWCTLKYKIK